MIRHLPQSHFRRRPGETMRVYLAEPGWSFTLGLGLLFESKNLSQRAAGETQRQQRAVGFVAESCCWSVTGQDIYIGHGLKFACFKKAALLIRGMGASVNSLLWQRSAARLGQADCCRVLLTSAWCNFHGDAWRGVCPARCLPGSSGLNS